MIIYTRKEPPCVYCIAAKRELAAHEIRYDEVDITEPGVMALFKERGWKTVPQITNNGDHIGGYEQLKEYLNGQKA